MNTITVQPHLNETTLSAEPLGDGRDWSGWLTIENIEAFAVRFWQTFGGKRFSIATQHDGITPWRLDLKTGATLRNDSREHRHLWLSYRDAVKRPSGEFDAGYCTRDIAMEQGGSAYLNWSAAAYSWGVHTSSRDRAHARERLKLAEQRGICGENAPRDIVHDEVYVEWEHSSVRITQWTGSRNQIVWLFKVEPPADRD